MTESWLTQFPELHLFIISWMEYNIQFVSITLYAYTIFSHQKYRDSIKNEKLY